MIIINFSIVSYFNLNLLLYIEVYDFNYILIKYTLIITDYVTLLLESMIMNIELNLNFFGIFYFTNTFNNLWTTDYKNTYYLDYIIPSEWYGSLKMHQNLFDIIFLDSVFFNTFFNDSLITELFPLKPTKFAIELNLFFYKSMFFLIIFYFINYFIGGKIFKYYSKIKIFKSLIKEVDQEFSNFEDYFFWSYVIFSSIIYSSNYISTVKLLAVCMYIYMGLILATVFFIPYYMIFVYMNDLSTKVKGVSKKNSTYEHSLLDYMTFIAFCLRFVLQCIRWILIIGTYMLFHEYFFEIEMNKGVVNLSKFLGINSYEIYKDNLKLESMSIFRIIFEYLDVLFVALIQTVAFFVVILWLFNFLFSYSNENWFESFLYYRQDHEKNGKWKNK